MEKPSFVRRVSDQFKKPVNLLVIGLFVGAFTILGLRVILVQNHEPHYHANFSLYINGKQDDFKDFTFYEEVQSCSTEDHNNPKHRTHMHNNEAGTVHVHADAVTWGAFFANIGYGLTDNLVKTDDGVFVDATDGKKLTFILNGKEESAIANRVIGDKDVLLIDYGTTDKDTLKKEYDGVPRTAAEHDVKPDPASCSGNQSLSFSDRLKRALDFTN